MTGHMRCYITQKVSRSCWRKAAVQRIRLSQLCLLLLFLLDAQVFESPDATVITEVNGLCRGHKVTHSLSLPCQSCLSPTPMAYSHSSVPYKQDWGAVQCSLLWITLDFIDDFPLSITNILLLLLLLLLLKFIHSSLSLKVISYTCPAASPNIDPTGKIFLHLTFTVFRTPILSLMIIPFCLSPLII